MLVAAAVASISNQPFDATRERKMQRAGTANATLNNHEVGAHCRLSDAALLEQAIERLGLSTRAYHRILKIARTIADLAAAAEIHTVHLSEAITYRRLDRPVNPVWE